MTGGLLEREGERLELERAVRSAKAGSGSIVLVEAGGGLGKTCLLDEAESLGATGRSSGPALE